MTHKKKTRPAFLLLALLPFSGACLMEGIDNPLAPGPTEASPEDVAEAEAELLELINIDRLDHALPPLTQDPGIEALARFQAQGMADDAMLRTYDANGRSGEERARYLTGDDETRCGQIVQWWGGAPSGSKHFDGFVHNGARDIYLEVGDFDLGGTPYGAAAIVPGTGPAGSAFEGRAGSYATVLLCDRAAELSSEPVIEE